MDRVAVFLSPREGVPPNLGIHLVDSDGNITPVAGPWQGFHNVFGIKWSPDGRHVAYHQRLRDESRPPGFRERYRVAVGKVDAGWTGVSDAKFTPDTYDKFYASRAEWSAASDRVYFAASHGGPPLEPGPLYNPIGTAIFAMTTDGDVEFVADIRPERLVHAVQPSPDGSQFLVTSRLARKVAVSVMDADGSNSVTLCCPPLRVNSGEFWASWSPDGQWVALFDTTSSTSAPNVLQIMRPDGSDTRTLIYRNEDGSLAPVQAR